MAKITSEKKTKTPQKKSALIVDDQPYLRKFVKFALEHLEFITEEADNGVTALTIANDYTPDLVILDVMMPEMDGMETLKELRNNSKLKNTIIIILTGTGNLDLIKKALVLGANDYILKPVTLKDLIKRVNKQINTGH